MVGFQQALLACDVSNVKYGFGLQTASGLLKLSDQHNIVRSLVVHGFHSAEYFYGLTKLRYNCARFLRIPDYEIGDDDAQLRRRSRRPAGERMANSAFQIEFLQCRFGDACGPSRHCRRILPRIPFSPNVNQRSVGVSIYSCNRRS